MVGAAVYIAGKPESIMGNFTALPMHIYDYVSRPQKEFQHVAAAAIIVLLLVLLSTNAIAILLRNKFQKTYD